jgi:hypothetical protein
MSGLFQRALELIRHSPESNSGDGIVFDEDSGISKEDQQDILSQIDQVVRDNRIKVSPETLKIRAQKRGTLFPLAVNIASVLLLAAGGFGFYLLFQQGESGLREEARTFASAEGRLIEELKKESEAQLLEKNREINQIQGRLTEIDQQRQDLQTNMEAKVAEREQQLRLAMESELAAERERLRQQGISESDITLRIQELETRKMEDYQQELVAFRRKAEEERLQTEANLQALQQEYQGNLQEASLERDRVLQEAQAQEAALREQLDTRTRALEEETRAARQELTRIAEQREKEELAARQLVGSYGRIRSDMENGRLEQALRGLDSIREYLNDPKIATLPNMMARRDVELFVLDSLSRLVRGEMSREEVDTSSLLAAANVVTELKARVVRADELSRQGQVDGAEALYREALALIPEVSRSHEYFLSRALAGQTARAAELREYLQRAGSAFEGGDYEATLANYSRALEYLPEERATVERIISQVRQAGFQLGLLSLRRDQSAAAADALARADRLLSEGQHNAAVEGYVDLIKRYPNSDQVSGAVAGINRAAAALASLGGGDVARLRKAMEEKDARIAALEAELEQKTAELARLRRQADGTSGSVVDLQSRLAEKEDEVAALTAELAKWKQEAEALKGDSDGRLAKLEEDLAVKVALIEALQTEKRGLESERSALRQEIQELRAAAGERTAEGPTEAAGVRGSGADSGAEGGAGTASLSEQLREVIARAEAAEARAQASDEQAEEAQTQAEAAVAQAQAADTRSREAEARAEAADERAQTAETQSEQARARAQEAESKNRELAARLERLAALEARYNRLVNSYQDYVSKETALLAGHGSSALIESKVHLNAFLASTEETFPGLWVRIKRYDEAFEKAGRTGAVREISDILYDLSYLGDPAERAQFLDREARRYPDDPLMREFLEELKNLQPATGVSATAPNFNRYLDLMASQGGLDATRMSLLDELALRSSAESRELFLETELVRATKKQDTELSRLVEDLLQLVRNE